jgi:hypothetical protein
MEQKLKDELHALNYASCQRAFKTNSALRSQVFQKLVRELPGEIEKVFADLAPKLHTKLSTKTGNGKEPTTLSDENGVLVSCHINSATAGQLRLQFFRRGERNRERRENGRSLDLFLDCREENAYEWKAPNESVTSENLAEYVVRNLLSDGAAVLREETP